MIKCVPDSIKALMRTTDNAERFQVGLRDDPESRLVTSKLALLEPGVECVVVILDKGEWEILEEAFNSLNNR